MIETLLPMGLNLAGGVLAQDANRKAARQANKINQLAIQDAIQQLEAIGIPSAEAMKLVYEMPELVGELEAVNYQDSAMEDIQVDPRLQQAQMDALNDLIARGDQGGLTEEDKLAFQQTLDRVNQDEQSRQAGILQNAAQMGNLDSGAALIAQLQSSGNATENARQNAMDMALAAANAKRDALGQAANTASNIQAQDWNRQSQMASAKDLINQYNARNTQGVAQTNLTNRQNIANMQTDIANRQKEQNLGAERQAYQDQLDRWKTKTGLTTGAAQSQANYEQQKGQAKADMYSGIGSGLADIYGQYTTAQDKKR